MVKFSKKAKVQQPTEVLLNANITQFDVLNRFLDDVDLVLTNKAWSVMVALIQHSQKNIKGNFSCYPSLPRLVKMTRISQSSVQRGIKELVELDLLTYFQRMNNSNYYTILACVDELPVWYKTKEQRINIMVRNRSKIKRLREILESNDFDQPEIDRINNEIVEIEKCGATKDHRTKIKFDGEK